jgi:hypothetical protein
MSAYGHHVSALRETKRQFVRRYRSPFADSSRPLIVHASHHKAGTVWLFGVLREIALPHALRVTEYDAVEPIDSATDIALFQHTHAFARASMSGRQMRGSHMVRDPRDLVVSAYFYHLRTNESWVHVPMAEFDGATYQERLQSFDKHDGLLFEMGRLAGSVFRDMAVWDYGQPDFFELKYEDLLASEGERFGELFRSYGFTDAAADRATATALELGVRARSRSGGDTHIRSGQPGEWREHFSADHVDRIKALAGDLILDLGYERTPDWTA